GVVPRVLWQKLMPPDENNRILMGLNSLLVQTPEAVVLIDTGIGELLKPRYYDNYAVNQNPPLPGALENIGFKPQDIDFVINSHLHFDHCGWNTRKDADGQIVPTFPNAKYVVQAGEFEAAMNPTVRDRASYLKQHYEPLKEAGVLWLVEGNTQITNGVDVVIAEGHTSHHQCVKITSSDHTVFFLGDLVPTSAHIGLPYIMSYDLFPLDTLKTKERLYEQAIEEKWIVAFNHDPKHFFGRIVKKEDKYVFSAIETESSV
ncbi:MBL fold metallo-hydrolase, partial [Acidobacteriota bacterium]